MLHPRQLSRAHFRHRNPFIPPQGNSRPIINLPIELLSRIFQFGTEDDWRGGVQDQKEMWTLQIPQSSSDACLPHPFQIIVSHVCQLWRSAATSTASLWTSITITPVSQPPYQHVAAFLERSKCFPINIRIYFGSQERDIRSRFESTPSMADLELLYSLLVPHVRRWRSVEVRAASNEQMYAFLNAVSDPTVTAAPQLTSLVLSANQPRGHDDTFVAGSVTIFGGSAPCLQSFCLERVVIDWSQDWISYASRLTTLELYRHSDDVCPSWDEFTTILRGAPALERLVLLDSGPCRDPPYIDPNLDIVAWDPNAPIQLLKLTHLSLSHQPRDSVCALIRMLYMPVLKSFFINAFWDDYTEFLSHITAPATVPATISTDERPQSLLRSLEVLDINCLLCGTEVIEILYDELENIRSLTISMDDSWYASSGCTPILPLLPPIATVYGAVNLRLPRLDTLFISDISDELHLDVIRDVVRQRNDAGFLIRSLNVAGTCDVGEEDMVWFEDNVETFVFSTHAER